MKTYRIDQGEMDKAIVPICRGADHVLNVSIPIEIQTRDHLLETILNLLNDDPLDPLFKKIQLPLHYHAISMDDGESGLHIYLKMPKGKKYDPTAKETLLMITETKKGRGVLKNILPDALTSFCNSITDPDYQNRQRYNDKPTKPQTHSPALV